jgi:2-amino-4-hydroxy-6-hydroxymethyldihydropteridine diphosphokinase
MVQGGFAELDQLPATSLLASSSLYASAPVGYAEQLDFINAVAKIKRRWNPASCSGFAGNRAASWQTARNSQRPRTLDLDLFPMDHRSWKRRVYQPPRMHERAFVLMPLVKWSQNV